MFISNLGAGSRKNIHEDCRSEVKMSKTYNYTFEKMLSVARGSP